MIGDTQRFINRVLPAQVRHFSEGCMLLIDGDPCGKSEQVGCTNEDCGLTGCSRKHLAEMGCTHEVVELD